MISVLDHGYVKFIERWGSDESVIEAARMSTNKGFRHWGLKACSEHLLTGPMAFCKVCQGDEGLLKYLYSHKHMTPFEMGGIVIEVQAPIFVFREWHRHRTQSYNELSARYTPLPDVNYIPSLERCLMGGGTNKQAQSASGRPVTEDEAQAWRTMLLSSYEQTQGLYKAALDWGIPKELARLPVPVGRYSRMRASTNLRNWLAFLTLRMDEAAQWEIRQYANAVGTIVQKHFPKTWDLFVGRA